MKRVVLAACVFALVVLGAVQALAHVSETRARLTGEAVEPNNGDPDATGRAIIKGSEEAETICYEIRFRGMRRATSAHIHHGIKGTSGDKELRLFTRARGRRSPVEGCRHGLEPELIEHIQHNPAQHYVDVHSTSYPDGALRGQLRSTE